MTLEKLYKPKEAADLMGVSKQTLAFWRHKKKGLPYAKIGGSIRYFESDINEFIQKNKPTEGELNEESDN